MKRVALLSALLLGTVAHAATITIATVNNPDMVVMQKLSPEFTKKYPDITVKWVVLPENDLHQKVTLDIASGTGAYDVATVGVYEIPNWVNNDWLSPSRRCSTTTPPSPGPTTLTTSFPVSAAP
ncbi:extracellular solute-binding protein (plasmid) [Deinococcus sp. KNUC1210]|nr:extracellular solute-binding protein [Deinococcus sp. KNUC1210]ULH17925.1 extracellular solute-binding protein [Deinococcus sp. KNUC1210]